MPSTLDSILAPGGAIARRLGDKYESRPEQMEMAVAVANAFEASRHLLVEAGTGVGKSFAYLLPAIDYAVRNKKRVVISTHTISLQEQLIEKDIPLLRSVYPDEFTAVLVKGRSNYVCLRRLEQARARQGLLFERQPELESLWMLEEWAQKTTDGSLADVPTVPESSVWEKVCAEHGNCLGKKCRHYEPCHWQKAKRRMSSGNILVVNHALFFSDLALRMAGVNYLPKYDLAILDEAHTIEDVAGQHFGIRISENQIKYSLRSLFDPRKARGVLSTYGNPANPAIETICELDRVIDGFFDRLIRWHAQYGKSNGRIRQANVVENDLSPMLLHLVKCVRAVIVGLKDEEDIAELTSLADKVNGMAEAVDAIVTQRIPDAAYWCEVSGRSPQRVSLHCAPVNVAEGLRKELFGKLKSVVMASATLCTAGGKTPASAASDPPYSRSTGFQPVPSDVDMSDESGLRQGAYLPHLTAADGIYAVTFRTDDSIPQTTLQAILADRDDLKAKAAMRELSESEEDEFKRLTSQRIERVLDEGNGAAVLRNAQAATVVIESLKHFARERYDLLAWSVMPNHVHVVLRPRAGYELASILHSWKRHTAKAINLLINATGKFWHTESYDHLVRDAGELRHAVEYADRNPQTPGWKTGLGTHVTRLWSIAY